MLHSVTINNVAKPNNLGASSEFVAQANSDATPHSSVLKILLDAGALPSTDGFQLATNGDGTEVNFPVSAQFANSHGEVKYQVAFPAGSIKSWMLELSSNPAAPLKETWEIREKSPEFQIDGAVVQ